MKMVKTNSFELELLDEGWTWASLNSLGDWEGSDIYFDTPYDALVDFFSNLICCEVVEE